ncbi:MAG: hypothetical protein M1817_006876 [Caeruleum heppii]|nr:MAG: hypothetical protein M1817_006876 [Caeruleum heppii]
MSPPKAPATSDHTTATTADEPISTSTNGEEPSAADPQSTPPGTDLTQSHLDSTYSTKAPNLFSEEEKQHHEAAVLGKAEGPSGAAEATQSSSANLTQQESPLLIEGLGELSLSSDNLKSSAGTLKPDHSDHPSQRPQTPVKDDTYLDPTPKTPLGPGTPSRTPSEVALGSHDLLGDNDRRSGIGSSNHHDSKDLLSDDDRTDSDDHGREGDSRSEIQSIMDQFDEEGGGPGVEEVMSPRLGLTSPPPDSPIQHPPRTSSLKDGSGNLPTSPTSPHAANMSHKPSTSESDIGPPVPPKPDHYPTSKDQSQTNFGNLQRAESHPSHPPSNLFKPPPPEPDPEPDLPFDFHRFLEQLRHRNADPVAGFLRSFLTEFGKKQWMVHEQVKIIGDFLAFITDKMAQCEVWRGVSDAEFDNAREGMEKLVMNRLYTQTFSPAIPPPQPMPAAKGRRKQAEKALAPGRRGQHQEDVERDDVLAQKVRIYRWVREEHLDIAPVDDSGRKFLVLAQQELLKIKTYRAPRDKIICVLNCCKVIFGLLRNNKSDQSADSFVPLLIYVVLQANPEHLVSNVQYILRFRNQDKLGGEAGYYLSSLLGAVQFIENLDRTTLSITDEDFEKNVEAAVSSIAERHVEPSLPTPNNHVHISEKSSLSRPEVTPRTSMDVEWSTPRRSLSSRDGTDGLTEGGEEKAAVAGLLRTIQRPLSSIGRIFAEEGAESGAGSSSHQPSGSNTPQRSNSRTKARPQQAMGPSNVSSDHAPDTQAAPPREPRLRAEDAAARQARAETAEAQRLQRVEHVTVVETLSGMFPDLDKEVIDDVVRMKEGRVGLAVDACLALNA